MNTDKLFTGIDKVMKSHQAVYRMIGVEHLSQAEAELQQQHSDGLFNHAFFKERLTGFRYIPPADFGSVKSILIVAVPQPTLTIAFRYKGSEHPVTLPPTYDQQTDLEVQESIGKILIPAGYRLSRARIPEKVMATHSGLMQYGRNNVGYVPGKGSFYRPVTFFTDLPCEEDHWESSVIMERCLRCRACIKACPTKAIGEDRFLLHAERCITFHNEHLKEIPDYIKSSMHHCLLGCMICQKVCPENRKFVDRIEAKENFSEKETMDILNGVPYNQLAFNTQQKLDRLSLTEDYSLLARNLGLLLT